MYFPLTHVNMFQAFAPLELSPRPTRDSRGLNTRNNLDATFGELAGGNQCSHKGQVTRALAQIGERSLNPRGIRGEFSARVV